MASRKDDNCQSYFSVRKLFQNRAHPNTSYSNIHFFSQRSQFSEMLKQCAKRACYTTLQKHDLLQPLPFENDQQFDCLLSVAVTTYLRKLSSLFH